MNILTEDHLKIQCPSIFSVKPSENTSSKYTLIPTWDIIKGFQNVGFYPVKAYQSYSKNKDNLGSAKHLIRLRHIDTKAVVGEYFPEIVLVNSHDGKSSYQLKGGVYRLVCSNGLTVGDNAFERRVRHQGDIVNQVVENASEIIEIFPQIIDKVEKWRGIELNPKQQIAYAEASLRLKYDDEELKNEIFINPQKLLTPYRLQDTKNDLWTTFNKVQERLIKGGVRYHKKDGTRNTTRAVNSVNENVRLNTALWTLTEKMEILAR